MRDGWAMKKLGYVCEINPKKPDLSDETEISFLGMASVEAESGAFDATNTRCYAEVKKGYTGFIDGDVIFAKITPCMENGKVVLVNRLRNSVGFGSTEFHVLRASEQIDGKYLFHFIVQRNFRSAARQSMTGSAGQLRVPKSFLEEFPIPLPPLPEQKAIVAKIEELFSELDNGIANLQEARRKIDIYRQSVLKKAFEGELTKNWRSRQPNLPTGEELLAQIQAERQRHYDQQLANWKSAVKAWEKTGKKGRKPGKPKKIVNIRPFTDQSTNEMPEACESWIWLKYEDICEIIRNGISKKPDGDESDEKILRISAVRPFKVDLSDVRNIKNTEGQYNEYFLKKGDLLFTRYNGTRKYVGVCGEYTSEIGCLYPDKIILSRLIDSPYLNPTFIQYAANVGISRQHIESRTRTTAGQSGISGTDIKSMPIPVCSFQEQTQIVQEIESRLSVCDNLTETIDTSLKQAEAMRQSILKKAFEGKLCPADRVA